MVVLLFLIGLVWSPFEPDPPPADPSGAPTGTVSWPDGDWNVLEGTVRSAASAGPGPSRWGGDSNSRSP